MSDEPTARVLHCWTGYYESMEFGGDEWIDARLHDVPDGTCMLPAGHPPPHIFTPDDEIEVRFL